MQFGRPAPQWAVILEAAKEFGIPPWRFEDECPVEWWARWVMFRKCRQFVEKPEDNVFDNDLEEDEW